MNTRFSYMDTQRGYFEAVEKFAQGVIDEARESVELEAGEEFDETHVLFTRHFEEAVEWHEIAIYGYCHRKAIEYASAEEEEEAYEAAEGVGATRVALENHSATRGYDSYAALGEAMGREVFRTHAIRAVGRLLGVWK